MVEVSLIAVSRPLIGDGDPRRLVELAIKTSAGKVREKGFRHYLTVERSGEDLNDWLVKAAKSFPSVLEHVVLTFMIEDISRVTSHQLVRHRIASYTQESLRYSVLADPDELREDYVYLLRWLSNAEISKEEFLERLEKYFVIPPSMRSSIDLSIFVDALKRYMTLIRLHNVSPEDARYVLPMAVKTRMMMTVNLRELLHMVCVRDREEAQWEIREVVKKMGEAVERELGIPFTEMKKVFCGGDR